MEKQPDEILLCKLDCLLMPNGEVLCEGKTLGWFDKLGKFLTPIAHADGRPYEE